MSVDLSGQHPPRRLGARLVRLVGLGLVLAAAVNLGLVGVSSADTGGEKKQVDAGIAKLRGQLEDTSRSLIEAVVQLQVTTAELPGARQVLAAATTAQGLADRHNEAVATALALAQASAAKAGDELARNTLESQQVQDQIGNLARDEYQQGGVSGLSIALEASSPDDFTNRMITMDTIMRIRDATLRDLDTMLAEGRAVRAHLVAVGQQVAALKVQAEAALAQATAARDTAAAAKTRLDRLYAAQARYAAGVAAKKAAELSKLKKMQARSETLRRILAARAAAARAAARAARQRGLGNGSLGGHSGFLSYPVAAPVSSEFGMRNDPVLEFFQLHAGIDFAAGCGTPVYAAAAGDVIMAVPESASGGYGNQLVIDHGLQGGVDLTTTYNHLNSFVVTGGPVSRGQLIAYVGTTGLSTGCHLHFETRDDGTPVNPRLWL